MINLEGMSNAEAIFVVAYCIDRGVGVCLTPNGEKWMAYPFAPILGEEAEIIRNCVTYEGDGFVLYDSDEFDSLYGT